MKKFVKPELVELDIEKTMTPGKGHHYGTDDNSGKHYGWGNGGKDDNQFVDNLSS